jgi:hypothetical protein
MGAGARTGPYLIVLYDGPNAYRVRTDAHGKPYQDRVAMKLTDVQLVGPSGIVNVGVIDDTTPTIGPFLPPGGLIVPRHHLETGTFHVSLTLRVVGAHPSAVPYSWSFTTT